MGGKTRDELSKAGNVVSIAALSEDRLVAMTAAENGRNGEHHMGQPTLSQSNGSSYPKQGHEVEEGLKVSSHKDRLCPKALSYLYTIVAVWDT